MSTRYLLGSKGILEYAIESTPYTAETTGFQELGFTPEEIEPSNPNPYIPTSTAGHDGVYVLAPETKEYEFDATTVVTDELAPIEMALGDRSEDTSEEDYDEWTFTEERPLPTATVRHTQHDADLEVSYIGTKANLSVEFSQNEPLNFNWTLVPAAMTDVSSSSAVSSSLPSDVSPYRFNMLSQASVERAGLDTEIATITGGSLNWDNGLEPNFHASAPGDHTEGRDAYSVSEETNAERYDMTLDAKVNNRELYDEAIEDNDEVDIELVWTRQTANSTIIDGVFIDLNDCKITSAPIPVQAEGSLDTTFQVQPTTTEIRIRRPS